MKGGWAILAAFGLGAMACLSPFAAEFPLPDPILPANAEGQRLAERLRHSWPEESVQVSGVLKIREHRQPIRKIPIRFSILPGANSWQAIYEIPSGTDAPVERLVITHTPGETNRYDYLRHGQSAAPFHLFQSLGGSDFWLVDLGLDFLHWPGQQLIKTEMRKGRWCRVLESSRQARDSREYQRVLSWIDKEQGQPILAEAYDAEGNLLKEFSIRSLEKVDGQWRLEEMRIEDRRKRSRTDLEFDLE